MDIPYNRNRLISIILCMGWFIQDYGREGYESFTASIDWIQYSLECCGVVSPSDYQVTGQSSDIFTSYHRRRKSHVKFLHSLSLYILMNGMMWQILLFWEHKIKYFVHIDCKFIFGLKSNNVFPSQTRGWNNIWTIFDLTIQSKV